MLVLKLFCIQDGKFQDWKEGVVRSEKKTSTVKFFKTVEGQDTFLYSAIVNHEEPVHGEINIIITAFDSTATDDLTCCVVMNNKKLYTTTASVYYKYYIEEYFSSVLEMFKNAPTKAKQYSCVVPQIGFQASHVMLTSSSCPETLEDYLPVIYPRKVPDGLAICAKVSACVHIVHSRMKCVEDVWKISPSPTTWLP